MDHLEHDWFVLFTDYRKRFRRISALAERLISFCRQICRETVRVNVPIAKYWTLGFFSLIDL